MTDALDQMTLRTLGFVKTAPGKQPRPLPLGLKKQRNQPQISRCRHPSSPRLRRDKSGGQMGRPTCPA
jgi:hypothetical protein